MMLWRSAAGRPGGCRFPVTRTCRSRIRDDEDQRGYSYGGPALAVKTVENLTGVKINHLIIVNLANFPKFHRRHRRG